MKSLVRICLVIFMLFAGQTLLAQQQGGQQTQTQQGQQQQQGQVGQQQGQEQAGQTLPATASPLAALALAGVASAGGALVIRKFRR